MTELVERIDRLRAQLPPHVRAIAVSKTFPPETIRAAYAAGLRDFGENRLQEALDKQAVLTDLPDLRWHFIGHLQSNKAKKALESFHWLHTCDSFKLAQRLDRLAAELELRPRVLIQVKPLPDPDKYGWELPELRERWDDIAACTHLDLRGLMAILPLGLSASESADGFTKVADLAAELRDRSGLSLPELSMGMSGDFPQAIAAGATMVRIGRALFGERR